MVWKGLFFPRSNKSIKSKQTKVTASEQAREKVTLKSAAAKVRKEEEKYDPAMKSAKLFFQYYNEHAIDKALQEVVAEKCTIYMKSDMTLTKEEFFGSVQHCIESFPDLRFDVGRYEKQPDGSVICYDVMVIGTHTGKPFGFGPYEPIDVVNPPVKVQNDPEDVQLIFDKDHKMTKYVFLTVGELSGPPGLYTQLGGFPVM